MSPPATGSSLPDLGGEGIGGMISVGAQSKGAAAGASGLLCPICNEEMVRRTCDCLYMISTDFCR
jgi:hypothetical protein